MDPSVPADGLQAKVFIAAHIPFLPPDDAGYVAIRTGSAFKPPLEGMVRDDVGPNISLLSDHFNECSALYWLWHNDTSPYVGLAHYRRYFVPKTSASSLGEARIASSRDFPELADGIDIVVPEPFTFRLQDSPAIETVEQQYLKCHYHFDLFRARTLVRETTPEFSDAFDFVMRNNTYIPFNMFVARREVIAAYCEWVFGILLRLETIIPYRTYDPLQGRVFGYLAERLFNVWLMRESLRLRIAHRPVVQIG